MGKYFATKDATFGGISEYASLLSEHDISESRTNSVSNIDEMVMPRDSANEWRPEAKARPRRFWARLIGLRPRFLSHMLRADGRNVGMTVE